MKNIAERDTTDAQLSGRRWIKAALLVFLVFALVALVFMIYLAEPILQARIIETLSARFQSPVQLAEFHVSLGHGFNSQARGSRFSARVI
jgi:O-antigen/teichoic acid export membrane protein